MQQKPVLHHDDGKTRHKNMNVETAVIVLLVFFQWIPLLGAKVPDASSTLLRMHRLYLQQPPHDTTLYNVLRVSPNATAAEITKSYRRLSRKYHPDKKRLLQQKTAGNSEEDLLERVREAYEILKDDSTRLPYHRYGLVDTAHALILLTKKRRNSNSAVDPSLTELLRLMGYDESSPMFVPDETATPSTTTRHLHQQIQERQEQNERIWFVATNLAESIRPLVEGSVSKAFLADLVATQCDRLKGLPMGAQILRCIGRAYRYSGKRFLRQHCRRRTPVVVADRVRHQWRAAKHVWTAAVASGRAVLSEEVVKRQRNNNYKEQEQREIEYHNGELGELYFDCEDDPPTDHEIREEARRKAQDALLESLQVEALWKISKIDLDRTIRKACDLILEGDAFFVPRCNSRRKNSDGWVGVTSGIAVAARVGRVRAAEALVMIGDIMVQRSKEGTAWME